MLENTESMTLQCLVRLVASCKTLRAIVISGNYTSSEVFGEDSRCCFLYGGRSVWPSSYQRHRAKDALPHGWPRVACCVVKVLVAYDQQLGVWSWGEKSWKRVAWNARWLKDILLFIFSVLSIPRLVLNTALSFKRRRKTKLTFLKAF